MSKDIRSFFKPIPKNVSAAAPTLTKKRAIIVSSDDDIVEDSPIVNKKVLKKKQMVVNSDSNSEKKLKPAKAADMFGNEPVKQSKVVAKKSKKKNDDFEKTLLQLDEDLPIDLDNLDKTIDEAVKKEVRPNGDNTVKRDASPKEKIHEKVEKKDNRRPETSTPSRKRKAEDDLNESGLDPDQERFEKKRHSAMLYQKYLNRSGPAHKGQKELPKGKADCIKNLCFLRTGVLDSLDRDDFDALIKEHGGRIVNSISKKVNYLVVGEDAGPAKLAKAESFGIKQITEDELLDLILTKSGMTAKYVDKKDNFGDIEEPMKSPDTKKAKLTEKKSTEQTSIKNEKKPEKAAQNPNVKKEKTSPVIKTEKKSPEIKKEKKSPDAKKSSDKPNFKKLNMEKLKLPKNSGKPEKLTHAKDLDPIERPEVIVADSNKSWTEKYKPCDLRSVIGQQGDKSNMKKLMHWLQNWYKNHSGKNKPKLTKPSPWAKNDDGAYFKCALLSGSPGVGKTTTATLVAAELGFDVVEFNASDTRSKKLLHEEVAQLLSTNSIASFFKDGSAPTKKHVLLMDEVDGMAGNEDRGGMQELIALIKNSNVPIICMCNDRQHPKIRSLVNYCLDLRFVKPRIEQIRGAMMSICFKEGLKISPDAMNEVIKGAGMDIRQTLNNLSMWTAGQQSLSTETAQKESNAAKKDTVLGPWEVIRKVFSEEDHKTMSVPDRARLFFYDYSIGPLFVQENYLQVVPHCPKSDILKRVAATADTISMGDLIEKKIRSTNNWSLLESQAMYSSVLPGHYMKGHFGGQINFPGWLGKNSKRGKFQRLLSELQAHMRTSISGSRQAVNIDYLTHIRNKIVKPLAKNGTSGIEESIKVMQAYNLLREDLDSILELAQWPKQKDPMAMVESKVKAAFTRAYNKEGPILPYANNVAVKKKTTAASSQEELYGDEEEVESDNEDADDITKDAMIKEKKKPAKGKKDVDTPAKKTKGKGKKPK